MFLQILLTINYPKELEQFENVIFCPRPCLFKSMIDLRQLSLGFLLRYECADKNNFGSAGSQFFPFTREEKELELNPGLLFPQQAYWVSGASLNMIISLHVSLAHEKLSQPIKIKIYLSSKVLLFCDINFANGPSGVRTQDLRPEERERERERERKC